MALERTIDCMVGGVMEECIRCDDITPPPRSQPPLEGASKQALIRSRLMRLELHDDCMITSLVRWQSRCVRRGVMTIYLTC